MAKFAPVFMKRYDGPEYVLGDLALSAATFVDDDTPETVIGALTDYADADDSVLSIVEDDGYVAIDGFDLVVGPTAHAAGTFDVTVRETNLWGDTETHDTVFEITVTAA